MRFKCCFLNTALVCLCASSPAYADGGIISDVVKGSIDATGAVVGTTGKVIGHLTLGTPRRDRDEAIAVVPGPRTYVMSTALSDNLCARRAALEAALQNAVEEKRASDEQAAALRSQLDSIMAANAADRLRESITFDEAMALARRLDDYSTKVTEVTERRFSPLVIVDPETHAQRMAATETVIQHFE